MIKLTPCGTDTLYDWTSFAMSCSGHREETEIYHVSVGHFLLLRCPRATAHSKVIWSRGERSNQTIPSGVEVRDGLLWFLPVQMLHNGTYTCEKRYVIVCYRI